MKLILLTSTLFLLVTMVSCKEKRPETTPTKFQEYVSLLPKITLPFSTSDENLNGIEIDRNKYGEFMKGAVYGTIEINDSIYGVIDLLAGDIVCPILTTRDIRGKEIASVFLLHMAGDVSGYDSRGTTNLLIDSKLNISITDSIQIYDRDSTLDGEPIIEKSIKNIVEIERYKVLPSGKIENIR